MSIERPNWKKWGAIDQVELWQAVALACDVAPERLALTHPDHFEKGPVFWYDITHDEVPAFDDRLDIARSHVGTSLVALRVNGGPDLRLRCFSTVRLADFARWAIGEGWELPVEFPRSKEDRRSGVDWTVWRHRPEAELWEVVALSLDIAPSSLTSLAQTQGSGEFSHYSPLEPHPKEFLDRLAIAEAHLGKSLKAVEIVKTKRRKYLSTVRLADFAAWFVGLDPPLQPPLPDEFPKPAPQREQFPTGNAWPWGQYETDLLKHLAAAVQEFWTKYDPSKPLTAPTNAKVIAWLKRRGVRDRTAEEMTKIIRADKAPRGPRPRTSSDGD